MASLSINTTDIIKEKKYPENYTNDILDAIKLLSYKNTNIIKTESPIIYGSASLKVSSPSDYDCYQKIKSNNKRGILAFVDGFKKIISNLEKQNDVYIADIKCGSFENLKIIDNDLTEDDYNDILPSMINKTKQLYKSKKIDIQEYKYYLSLLKPNLKNFDIAIIKKEIRPNIARWTPEDIKRGYLIKNGEKLTLAEGINQKELTKIDIIIFHVNRYTEISMVYLYSLNNKIINQGYNEEDRELLLQQTIPPLIFKDNYFKVSKRVFAIERYRKNSNLRVLEILIRLFNSDIGRLYQIVSDIDVLLYMFENYDKLNLPKISYTLNQIRFRTSNFINKDFERHENKLLDLLGKFENDPKKHINEMSNFRDEIFNIMNGQTKKYLEANRLLPIPAEYLPFYTETEETQKLAKKLSVSKLKTSLKGSGNMTKYKKQYLLEDNDDVVGSGSKTVKMPIKALIKEHQNLIDVLLYGNKKDRKNEANDQYMELQSYLKDYN
jgi:hypothetical protein